MMRKNTAFFSSAMTKFGKTARPYNGDHVIVRAIGEKYFCTQTGACPTQTKNNRCCRKISQVSYGQADDGRPADPPAPHLFIFRTKLARQKRNAHKPRLSVPPAQSASAAPCPLSGWQFTPKQLYSLSVIWAYRQRLNVDITRSPTAKSRRSAN